MKVYVAAPGQHSWPTIPDDVQERLLKILSEQLSEENLHVSLKRTRKRKTSLDSQSEPLKQHFAIGLRCVMRCLKQNRCSLVFVCSSLTPMILSKPILLLSQLYSIPSIRLKNLSAVLTKLFNIPHCAVFALKSSAESNPMLTKIIESVKEILQGCSTSTSSSSSVNFVSGQLLAPYQNPKRISSGVKKKKLKKKKTTK